MAKKSTSKNISKKNKKKNVSKKNNYRLYIIIFASILTIILIAGALLFNNKNTKIICKNQTENINNVKQNNVVTINFAREKISSISETREIMLNNKISDFDGIEVIKDILENEYKKLKIHYEIKKEGNNLIVISNYDKSQKYILDNVMISMENDVIGMNVIQDDPQNNHLIIDLSKNYSKTEITKFFEDNNYSCK